MQKASTKHYFGFDYCVFAYKIFWAVIGVSHRETSETLENIFIKFEMGCSRYIWGFKKLTFTHAEGFNGTLFWLRFLCSCV